jgi:hypothetical protein
MLTWLKACTASLQHFLLAVSDVCVFVAVSLSLQTINMLGNNAREGSICIL